MLWGCADSRWRCKGGNTAPPSVSSSVPRHRTCGLQTDTQRQRTAQSASRAGREAPGQPQERPRSLSRPPVRDEDRYLDDEGGEDSAPPRRFQGDSSPPRNTRAM